ncbi:CHC2 zinc finger domain-containing protein [Candidatus Vidania fulgoroideorum]
MLKKNFILCPFHKENQASMLLNKKYFYCFGCKKTGNINKINNKKKINKKKIINKLLKIFLLCNNLTYLKSIFLARGYNKLKKLLKFNFVCLYKNINLNVFKLNEVEILLKNKYLFKKHKKYYSYINKLIIPIKNTKGEVVTFVAKLSKPKYLFFRKLINYKKDKILYGYWENKKIIKKKKQIFIVEGFFDLFRLNYIGVNNSVALLGCHISKPQIKFIKKLKKQIFFILDDDLAAKHSIKNFCFKNLNLAFYKYKIFFVKIKTDPDLFFKNFNKKKFLNYIKKNSIYFTDLLCLKFFKILKFFFVKNFFYFKNKLNVINKKKIRLNYLKNKKNFLNKFLKKNKFNKKKFYLLYNFKKKKYKKFLNFNKKKILVLIFIIKKIMNFVSKNIFFYKNYLKKYENYFFLYKKFILKINET